MPLGVVLNGLVEIDLILRVLGSNLSLEGLFEVGLLQEMRTMIRTCSMVS